LATAYEHLKEAAVSTADIRFIQSDALHGRESGEFPYLLGMMNLLLHGVVEPDVQWQNSLERDIRSIKKSELYDVILTNPPFGGSEHPQVQQNFPIKSSSTQLLFMQLIVASLKKNGRLAVVLPESFLSNDDGFRTFREKLLQDWNVHTIVGVPAKGIWYKDVKTDLVFIDGPGPTKEILYVEIQPPAGAKNFSRVRKPLTRDALDPYLILVKERQESEHSWIVAASDIPVDLDLRPKRPDAESALTLQDAAARLTRVREDLPRVSSNLVVLDRALDAMLESETAQSYGGSSLRAFLTQRRRRTVVLDDQQYKRLRVALHGRGVFLRDEVAGREIKVKTQYVVNAGEFVVAEIDAKLGGMGLVPTELDGAIVSSHYFSFEVDPEICRPGWLILLAQSGFMTRQFAAKGATNYASVRPDDVLDLEVPLPDPTEQDHLLALVDAAAAAESAARRMGEELFTVLQEFRLGALAGRLARRV
jgi:hypothetical protein